MATAGVCAEITASISTPSTRRPARLLVDSTGTTDKYCGVFSWLLGVLCCWCVVCCPCDSRQVYNAPDGKKVLASGTPSGQCGTV